MATRKKHPLWLFNIGDVVMWNPDGTPSDQAMLGKEEAKKRVQQRIGEWTPGPFRITNARWALPPEEFGASDLRDLKISTQVLTVETSRGRKEFGSGCFVRAIASGELTEADFNK